MYLQDRITLVDLTEVSEEHRALQVMLNISLERLVIF